MQKSCICEFLYGSLTSETAIFQLKQALSRTTETQVIILMKKKDGTVLKLIVNGTKFKLNFKIKRYKLSMQYHYSTCKK